MEQSNGAPALPEWMRVKNEIGTQERSRGKLHFIRKSMKHLSEIFENEFFCEKYAGLPLLLQKIDPRIKIVVLLSFLVFGSFARSVAVLVVLSLIPMAYARLSGLEMRNYIRRTWCYLPVLVLLLSIPGASSLFVRGAPLFYLVPPGVRGGIYFSINGIEMALRLVLRAGISLSFGFLLLMTTRWSHITEALAAMRVPSLFISILNMAYRYIFVMSAAAGDMMEARFLRTTGSLSMRDNRRFMGHSAAHLFLKSHFMSEEIYDAMCCRGFTGRPVSLQKLKLSGKDFLFLINNGIIILMLIAGEALF